MSLFYFNLNNGHRLILDPEGTDLPSRDAAERHATLVAREIMRNNRSRTLTWRLHVCDSERRPCFELLFASVNEDLDHLSAELRNSVTSSAHRVATLNDDIRGVRQSLRELRATLARADRVPYLVAVDGMRVGGVSSPR